MRVQFLQNHEEKGETYHAGFDYELDDGPAKHFVKEGVARENPLPKPKAAKAGDDHAKATRRTTAAKADHAAAEHQTTAEKADA